MAMNGVLTFVCKSYHIKIYRGIMAKRWGHTFSYDHITSRFIGELWHAKDDK